VPLVRCLAIGRPGARTPNYRSLAAALPEENESLHGLPILNDFSNLVRRAGIEPAQSLRTEVF
jgi:hypothetical protein